VSEQLTRSTETFDVKSSHLVEKVKELVREGNVRRITINDSTGQTVLEIPVTVGVVGVLVAPALAAIAALAALVADYSIEVERDVSDSTDVGGSSPDQG
jgi:hypothetical protein